MQSHTQCYLADRLPSSTQDSKKEKWEEEIEVMVVILVVEVANSRGLSKTAIIRALELQLLVQETKVICLLLGRLHHLPPDILSVSGRS